ncbi:hypothetical protein AVEN_209042-1 [Araneus ventricosus]|uniref:Uncharacterized protein n=1 Tax=Araneus ventricosus TaxID=182803 RepID=A0A4Y2KHX7_ARAVE|nr:hypothetical protein AVEN_209042-1 [Araneus ventricosus]
MYHSFQNETNPLPKLWILISDSESESVIPNPGNQSESNSDSADSSRIRFRGFITFPIPGIHHESDSSVFVPFGRNRIRSFLLMIRILRFVPELTTHHYLSVSTDSLYV